MGHSQSPRALAQGQPLHFPSPAHPWHPCCRRCLLKGCERWFLPRRPQARYCSPSCQQAARRWRRWHASQRYRATTHGKQRRRDQARRHRSRRPRRGTRAEPPPPSTDVAPQVDPPEGQPPPATDPSTATPPASVGQRPDEIPEQSAGLPCDRPGCYVLFLPTPRSPHQHFCCCGCRQALRRVRQREARLRHRRRWGSRPSRRPPRDPPFGSPAHVVTY